MELSIFPKINFHPTKEEKPSLSKKASKPHRPVTKSFSDEEQLFELVTQYGWSPSVFTGYRENASFSFCDVMAMDIDDGMRIEDAELICQSEGFCALIAPSPSFSEELHKFRVVIPLVERIRSKDVYDATWQRLAEIFPAIDSQCCDYARFYFPCKPDFDNTVWVEGDLMAPVIPVREPVDESMGEYNSIMIDVNSINDEEIYEFLYGDLPTKVPEPVHYFVENASTGLSGEWINRLNACCFTLALQGVPDEKIWASMEKIAPRGELSTKDEYQIDRAIRDGSHARVELEVKEEKKPRRSFGR